MREEEGLLEDDELLDEDQTIGADDPAVSRRFAAGIGLIIVSLVMGKLVLLPLVFAPTSAAWRAGAMIAYGISWVPLFVGVWLAGMEGYRLSVRLYKEYQLRVLRRVREGGQKAVAGGRKVAAGTAQVIARPVQGGVKVAAGAVKVLSKPVEGARRTGRRTVEIGRSFRSRRAARRARRGRRRR
jgi:hypothetical protein